MALSALLVKPLMNTIFLMKGITRALISVYFELWQFILRKQLADAQYRVDVSCSDVPESNKETDGIGWCPDSASHRGAAQENV